MLRSCYKKCEFPQVSSDRANKNLKVQRAEKEIKVFIMTAGVLLIQRLKWQKGRKKERKNPWGDLEKNSITDIAVLEVGDLPVPFVRAEHSGWVQFEGLLVKAAFLLSFEQSLHWWIYYLPYVFLCKKKKSHVGVW